MRPLSRLRFLLALLTWFAGIQASDKTEEEEESDVR